MFTIHLTLFVWVTRHAAKRSRTLRMTIGTRPHPTMGEREELPVAREVRGRPRGGLMTARAVLIFVRAMATGKIILVTRRAVALGPAELIIDVARAAVGGSMRAGQRPETGVGHLSGPPTIGGVAVVAAAQKVIVPRVLDRARER